MDLKCFALKILLISRYVWFNFFSGFVCAVEFLATWLLCYHNIYIFFVFLSQNMVRARRQHTVFLSYESSLSTKYHQTLHWPLLCIHQTHCLSVLEKGWGLFIRRSLVSQGRKVFDLFCALLLVFFSVHWHK